MIHLPQTFFNIKNSKRVIFLHIYPRLVRCDTFSSNFFIISKTQTWTYVIHLPQFFFDGG